MDLQAMARDISTKLEAAGFPKSEAATRQVFNLAEEVGEFVGAYRRWKGMARRKGTFDDVAKELADVVITAYVTAEELGISLESEIAAKLEVIYSRGWHEARVWRTGDPMPPADVTVLRETRPSTISYLIRRSADMWSWGNGPDDHGGEPFTWTNAVSKAVAPLGIVEQAQPRVWQVGAPQPADVKRVLAHNGVVFSNCGLTDKPWFATYESGGDGRWYSWWDLVNPNTGPTPLTEVVEGGDV